MKTKNASVHHSNLWGLRDQKYNVLKQNNVFSLSRETLKPDSSDYLFVPQNVELREEYQSFYKITEIMPLNSVGIVTARDKLTIHFTPEEVWETVKDFASLKPETAREKYNLGKDAQDWKVHFAQNDLKQSGLDKKKIVPVLYRPFDKRWSYYTGTSRGFICRPREEVMRNMLEGENLGLIVSRIHRQLSLNYFFCSNIMCDFHILDNARDSTSLYPLFLYKKSSDEDKDLIELTETIKNQKEETKVPNLTPEFLKDFSNKLKMDFIINGTGDLNKTFGPEDVFHYIYSVFHSPTYRERYSDFLKMDFPRVPIPSDPDLFRKLCKTGEKLCSLHLMEANIETKTLFPVKGSNTVEKVKYDPLKKAVFINQSQYFSPVPENVWEFHIGGYQVCEKWLKSRKNRKLSGKDIDLYCYIVSALEKTISFMQQIDHIIDSHGAFPGAFVNQG